MSRSSVSTFCEQNEKKESLYTFSVSTPSSSLLSPSPSLSSSISSSMTMTLPAVKSCLSLTHLPLPLTKLVHLPLSTNLVTSDCSLPVKSDILNMKVVGDDGNDNNNNNDVNGIEISKNHRDHNSQNDNSDCTDKDNSTKQKWKSSISSVRTHIRSASHGGTLTVSTMSPLPLTTTMITSRPSALKKTGHQRAFSQGQVIDVKSHPPVVGHSRVGSKTDFLLPPGYREKTKSLNNFRVSSFRGHTRQSSRSESIYTIRRTVAPPWWRRILVHCFGPISEESSVRTIVPNHLLPYKMSSNQSFNGNNMNNRIRTTKYTLLTFLPCNLLEQFHRVANLYFVFILALNWVPAINAFGKEIAMIPVIFVLGITAMKDFFEERRRLMSDQRINNLTCRVYVGNRDRYKKMAWKDVKVGDLIYLSNNELVPADVLLLRSSDPQGFAYLDTCNLDGETNLKQRQIIRGLFEIQNTFEPSKFRSVIEVNQPSTKIYRFHGAVVHPSGARVPISTENLLLRECFLKNTDFVEGIVVYAGHETKAMLNNRGRRHKRSRLENQMDVDVVWCVVILIVLCFIGALGCRFWLSIYTYSTDTITTMNAIPFLNIIQDPGYEGMLAFLTFIIILQVMIPLSLYVTIEMTKAGQVYHIGHDPALRDSETGRRAECRVLNITEELGQVQYIFSDKTGTLTENKMLFRRCIVGDQDYEHTADGETLVPCARLKEDLLISSFRHRLQEFLISLAICNTVVVNNRSQRDAINISNFVKTHTPKNDSFTRENILNNVRNDLDHDVSLLLNQLDVELHDPQNSSIYEAESPDELALVKAAQVYKVNLLKRTAQSVVISLPNKTVLIYEILHILPFDSNRRCMSIIVRHPNTGEIILYSKGADSTLLTSLSSVNEDSECSSSTAKIKQYLHCYARQGLRTLVIAKRSLAIQEYEIWRQKHAEAESAHQNREQRMRDSYTNLEKHLTLLGATGIEDKLQAGVPEAVSALVSAGIVLWVLTGDKVETAVNIAYAARLFSPTMKLLRLQAKSKNLAEVLIYGYLEAIQREDANVNTRRQLIEYHNQYGNDNVRNDIDSTDQIACRISSSHKQHRALIVDGKTLTFILDPTSGLMKPFLELTKLCSSVLACRTTPLQKAYIVRIVKEMLNMRTLAIGDGANDVSMIRTADVGVGVAGHEGTQAIMAADFAIGKFSMLVPLLLLHGHWCYDRLSRMILYFFYKNATFVFLTFWYQLYCGFSGTVMFDQVYLMLYNLLFTSLPPLALGIYDRIAPASILLKIPKLYERGRLASVYQPHSFWITMADALYESIVIFFLTEAVYYNSEIDIWEFGTTIMSSCIITMLAHASIEMKAWTIIHVSAILASVGIFFGFCLFYNGICVNCMGLSVSYWVMEIAITRPTYWLTMIISSVLALLPRLLYKAVKTTITPDTIQINLMKKVAKSKNVSQNSECSSEPDEMKLVAKWCRSTKRATISLNNHATKYNTHMI